MKFPNRSQVIAPAFAVLLVFSAMGGGFAVQPAAATHNCGQLESTAVFVTGPVGDFLDQTFNNADCTSNHKAQAIEDLRESEGNQTKLDIYNAALEQNSQSQTEAALYDNYLNDTESAAWMRAEIAIAEAYENGSSKAVAKSKARQAIAEYYAVKQKNLIESYNASARGVLVSWEAAKNVSEIDNQYVDIRGQSLADDDQYGSWITGETTVTVQLVNGSSAVSLGVTAKIYATGGSGTAAPSPTYHAFGGAPSDHTDPDTHRFVVEPPTSSYNEQTILRPPEYADRNTRIEQQNTALQAEVDPFVNNTWEAYQNGQINSSDVLSRNTQMFRYGAEAGEGSDLYTTVAALSQMGLDTPELNGTGTMTVVHDNMEYHGLVMAREAPNGTWSANTTYNGSAIDGPVFLATTSGKQVDLDGEFRISSISSTDGSTIDNVTATKVVYRTSNTSEQLDKMKRISELRKEIEAKQQSAGGGGSGSPIDPKYLLGALAIIGVLAYSQGQKRGD